MSTCARCADLTRQLREAREELAEWTKVPVREGGEDRREQAVVLCNRLRQRLSLTVQEFRPGEVRLLMALLDRKGRPAKRDDLLSEIALDGDRSDAHSNLVSCRVAYLRRVLKQCDLGGAIETVVGVGYLISSANRDRVLALLAEVETA